MWPFYVASGLIGYLLGSIPFGFLVGRARGIDIREHGSGNIGATNVVRVLGKRLGYIVFLCDALKGLAAVWLGYLLVQRGVLAQGHALYVNLPPNVAPDMLHHAWNDPAQSASLGGILAALACILGHNFPVWLKFRGGKGVATTVGVLLGLMPAAFAAAAIVWLVSFYLSRYVSVASLLAAAVLPLAVGCMALRPGGQGGWAMFAFSVAAAVLIFWRHRSNIQRLFNGTESRFISKSSPTKS